MIIKDLFVRISQLMPDGALAGIFQVSSGESYNHFRNEVINSPLRTPIDGISDFIFGIDAESAQKRISQVSGIYVFVDYGEITTTIDSKSDVKSDLLRVALTVARPMPTDQDQVAEALSQDRCLEIIGQIRRSLRDDVDIEKNIWWMRNASSIKAFSAKALANSLGWSMEFDVVGIDAV